MKFLKLTLVALFSIALLTAVLPSTKIEPTVETTNLEVKTTSLDLVAIIDRVKAKMPTQG